MNLILLTPSDFLECVCRVRLHDRRYVHIRDILRAKTGGELHVGLLGGRVGTGKIISITDHDVEMDVHFHRDPPAPLAVTLILALPRPNMLKRILMSAASLGVKRIYLLNSRRVEKSFWRSPVLVPERIHEYLILGLEQAKDTILPEVYLRQQFKPFMEDELPTLAQGTLGLLAHPQAEEPCPRQVREPVTLAIGPEGGFIDYEIKKFMDLGFKAVSLGERVLRVETAVAVLLSKLF